MFFIRFGKILFTLEKKLKISNVKSKGEKTVKTKPIEGTNEVQDKTFHNSMNYLINKFFAIMVWRNL